MTFIRQQFVAKNKQSTEIELNWAGEWVSVLEAVPCWTFMFLLSKMLPRARHRSFKSFSDGLNNFENTNQLTHLSNYCMWAV